ncbi:MAG: flavin reductase family protein [Armatimonadota bacterium]
MNKRPVPAEELNSRAAYTLMHMVVQPRPIGWVGTVSSAGIYNIAPFSYFMPIGSAPPTVAFSSAKDRYGNEKNTLDNVMETAVFTLNMVTADLMEQMNASSATFPAEVSEFEAVGLNPRIGNWTVAPYVDEAFVSYECRLLQTVALGNATLVIGEVVGFHLSEQWESQTDVPPIVGRLDASNYLLTSGERISIPRPE